MRQSHAILLGAGLLLFQAPDAASAVDPGFPNNTVPESFHLVASNGSAPANIGQFEVVLRDIAHNPIPNASIVVDLSSCTDLALATDQLDPDAVVNCAAKTTRKLTDANGRAVFCIIGGSRTGVPASTLLAGGRIYGNGTLIASPTVSAFDLDGQQGLGAGDLALFLGDFASGQIFGRSDFDDSGNLGAGDLVIWLTAFSSGTQVVSAAVCP